MEVRWCEYLQITCMYVAINCQLNGICSNDKKMKLTYALISHGFRYRFSYLDVPLDGSLNEFGGKLKDSANTNSFQPSLAWRVNKLFLTRRHFLQGFPS